MLNPRMFGALEGVLQSFCKSIKVTHAHNSNNSEGRNAGKGITQKIKCPHLRLYPQSPFQCFSVPVIVWLTLIDSLMLLFFDSSGLSSSYQIVSVQDEEFSVLTVILCCPCGSFSFCCLVYFSFGLALKYLHNFTG